MFVNSFLIDETHSGKRLDRFLAEQVPSVTRSQIKRWIESGHVRLQKTSFPAKPSYLVRTGDCVEVTPPVPSPARLMPEHLPLDILYEDHDVIVINKDSGMVVHPGAGRNSGTLVNALLAHCRDLAGIGDELRPGIVHRLDKGTSGVMVVAKSHVAHTRLVSQFQSREIEKIYLAIVLGKIKERGKMTASIGRHPSDRKRMSTSARRGRAAETSWTVREYFDCHAALVEARIGTGRTHQIRVHFSSAGHPLIGDATYGGRGVLKRLPGSWQEMLANFSRPALHAFKLGFVHPSSGEKVSFEAPLPTDMLWLVQTCRELSLGEV